MKLDRIVSGGQTGADRAALDVALRLGLAHGGWVPLGRLAEDGSVPERYGSLRETASADHAERTRCNVRDSDATVVFCCGDARGGTALTVETARELARPLLLIDIDASDRSMASKRLRQWLHTHAVRVLNVAGPRASEQPRIYAAVEAILSTALRPSDS